MKNISERDQSKGYIPLRLIIRDSMTREEVLEEYQNKDTYYNGKEFHEILSDIFLESDNPKELVDKACNPYKRYANQSIPDYYNNFGHLKEEVYDLPVEGYKNLYDYICSLDYIKKVVVCDSYKKRQEYIDITLKRVGLAGITFPINTEILCSIYSETGKTVLEEFFTQLTIMINNGKLNLFQVDSLRLAKDLYKKGLFKLLKVCDENLLFQIIDEDNKKTTLDVLVENNLMYELPIFGVQWKNSMSFIHDYHILDKEIPSLHKTVLEYILEENMLERLSFYNYIDDIDYWKRILKLVCKIGRVDLLYKVPCSFLKWKINEEDPNSIDYYTLLKNNGIKYQVFDEINDTRVAYDCLMDDSTDLSIFLSECNFGIFKSKYKAGSNETIASLFFSILYNKDDKTRSDYIRVLGNKGWLDEEIINTAYYKGILIRLNNRDFYDIYIGINANHALDYAIYDDGLKERYEFNVDYLSAEFLNAYENDSDENTLNAILTSYFAYKETNPVEAQKELKLLIDIKKENPRFIFKNSTLETQVAPLKKQVLILNCFNLSSLNHELAHLLFYNLTDDEIEYLEKLLPDTKDEKTKEDCLCVAHAITNSIYISPRTHYYSKEFNKYIESRFGSVENYKDIMREEYKVFIGDHKILADYLLNEKINIKSAGMLANAIYEDKKRYSEDWAIEEYVTYRYETEQTTFVNEKIKKDYRALLIYENFMDAYYGGLLETIYSIKLKRRKRLMATSTHGEEYFFSNKTRVDEMFADFIELKKQALREEKNLDKSKDPFNSAYYYLEMIKKNCGEEVYNGLELLYKKALDRIQLDEEITIQDSKRV